MSDLFNPEMSVEDVLALGDKDVLEDFVKSRFGKEIDKAEPWDELVKKVTAWHAERAAPAPPRAPRTGKHRAATHLLNRATGHWFPRTPALDARGDLVPCDDEGRPL